MCRLWSLVCLLMPCGRRWPGYLDNTIAGGIPAGMSAWESLVKEAEEEGNISGDVVRRYARGAGAVSYFFQ